jgi:Icc-related predicted phosphoesterase
MKILATADIHGSQYRLNILLKNIERFSPDLVIICGDITQFGPGELAKNFLNQIPVETLAVTGNIDSKDVKQNIDESNATNIELKKVVKKGLKFVGLSGIKSQEVKFIEEKKLVDEKTVLVSHVPPYGFQDKVFIGMHGGNKELTDIINKYHPQLVLCGHIHEDPGFTKNGKTIIINCSMGKRGEGALIDINEDISVKMLE